MAILFAIAYTSHNQRYVKDRAVAYKENLSMAIDVESYILNDSNRDLINLFRVLKEHKGGFCPTLSHISHLQIIQNVSIMYLENDLINWAQARKRQFCFFT